MIGSQSAQKCMAESPAEGKRVARRRWGKSQKLSDQSTQMNLFRQFLKVEHAEQIFAAQLEKILAGRVPGLEAVDLLGSLMTICGRPTDDDLSRLFASLPDHPDAVLPVLKVLCRQQDHLVKHFDACVQSYHVNLLSLHYCSHSSDLAGL